MELEQFVKDTLIAILKGCQQGETDQSAAGTPVGIKEGAKGIEFDLGITFYEGKPTVVGIHSSQCHSRLRFFVPIINK